MKRPADRILRWQVPAGAEGPLLEFLSDALAVSHKAAKRILDERRVFVNGRRVWMARHPLHAGDRVEVQPAAPPSPRVPVVLVEADPYLIVDKPPGILSNEGPNSVEAWVRRSRGEPGWTAAHRLDRDTSGCLLLGRTPEAVERVIPLFRERQVEKVYWALVWGAYPPHLRVLTDPVDGAPACTCVRVLGRRPEVSLLEVRIETGRTHQIRRHLAAAGYPIAGDRMYGTSRPLDARARAVPRQMLHARHLAFPHPVTTARISATAPVPSDFRQVAREYGLRLPPGDR